MAGGLLNVGLSGLLATQRALTVTGHNISNANTEGYSRQRVDLTSRLPQLYDNSNINKNKNKNTNNQNYDNFLIEQVRSSTAASASSDTFSDYVGRIDNLLAGPGAGGGAARQ